MKPLVQTFSTLVLGTCALACSASVDEQTSTADDAVETTTWLARGAEIGRETNRVPNIPIVGREYTASMALFAVSPAALPGNTYRGAVLLNPGAVVRSADQKTLAEALAKRGYVTYVANNPVGEVKADQGGPATGPIPLLVGNLIPNVAKKLSSAPRSLDGLPDTIARAHEAWNATGDSRLSAIGHSLGGAVLGNAAARSDTGLSRIILIGVDEFVDAGFPFGLAPPRAGNTPVKLTFLRGEDDGLADPAKISALAAKHPNSDVLPSVAGVNHFCIIDGNPGNPREGLVGAPGKRAMDGTASLPTVAACVNATLEAVAGQLD